MTTHYKDNTYKTAIAVSQDALHHTVTIKDDYGNNISTIHYQGVSAQAVRQDLADQKFEKEKDMF